MLLMSIVYADILSAPDFTGLSKEDTHHVFRASNHHYVSSEYCRKHLAGNP